MKVKYGTFHMVFALLLSLAVPFPIFASALEINIERALELATANNNRIKIAKSDVTIARETRRQSHRARGVTVSATHASTYTDFQNDAYTESTGKTYANSITASYPLYTGGTIKNTIKMAESDYNSKNEALRKTHQDVKLDVVSSLYQILRAADSERQAEESVKRLAAHVENVKIQYENGKVGKADLLRSEVELSGAKQSLIRAASENDTAIKQLNSLMGIPLGTKLIIKEKMTYEKYALTLEECVAFATRTHPDLIIAVHAIEAAEAGVLVARGQTLPQASISAVQALGSQKSWPGTKEDTFSVKLNVDYTFMDAGVGASKISSAKESARRAKHNYEQALESVVFSVNSRYNDITEAALRVEESKAAIGKAEEAYGIAVNRYNEGVGANIDVVDSQNALTTASSNYTQALCDYSIALARIENSMGGPLK